MFKRSKVIARGSPPATPRVPSISLPSFGGRGYESDSMTKATSLRRPYATAHHTSDSTSPVRHAATSKLGKVFTIAEECFSPQRRSSMTTKRIPIKARPRTSSISSVSSQSWGESFMAKPALSGVSWPSSQNLSSRGGPPALQSKPCFGDDLHSSWEGTRSRKSSFTSTPQSGGGTSKNKLKDVNITIVPMKQEAPTAVHWQLIPYSVRKDLRHPPLHFNIACDIEDNKDNICFSHVYPRRPLSPKDLNKTACDVEQMVVRCDDLPKWAKWLVVINCSKDNIIRCGDVFREIHKTFHRPLTPGELACIPASEKKACEKAFEMRCEANAGLTAWNKKQGMKRVDFLRDKTIFNGLTFDQQQSIWVLHLVNR